MATETTTSTSACVDASGGAIGMPQLCPDWFTNQIFWLVIALLAIFFVLSKIALPRIAAVLAERSGTISNDLASAEDLKRKAVEAEEAYNKALADARAEAQSIAAQTRAEIKADLDDAIAKADAEIAAKAAEGEAKIAEIRAGAMESVSEVAKDVAAEIVTALGQTADAKTVGDAVAARLKG
ncbi:F0F1 ATP synthase subunit B' [Thalassobacter stenotrophicus]|uniref:ATP synthase subunit b n=2 Tax=Thalassobacter stenotrophicus TaxID=266809 RepID=A0A0P1F2J3_9RHOB|nr:MULTISPECIES: F0F1 ATP synthase subunit B' [Thalassobacter]KGK80462.1 ATP F0F1 synthase subunit B' [Thalassobacter stenotrophicus]KGL01845.1 ATP F0F1 synthase subunit B' [Thalassobacter sp. 16PALIMAR09]PVZ49276.1 ATP F0F1 synthase subunit B' [Thalassobacter stenotrophicus]UYP67244.1 F0F1 ATP synthase subunit B' [Thalassobacter stenotrophicus]CUH61720.1 F-type ATPase subunit b' [Thalassobacter stenotrophicus]